MSVKGAVSKAKGFLKKNSKALTVSCVSALTACLSAVSFSAAETDVVTSGTSESMIAQFSESLTQMQGDIINLILTAIPIALTIFGLVIACNKGISVVKSMIGKA